MYTGTLIRDLLAAVERAELRAEQQRVSQELHEIFSMQIPIPAEERVFEGAA
ncbi:MAG TPA: hypothetical protein VMX38_18300 [Verrucomicrobiae bacterium]|jgi:hypothetical protein|nr:hypothetical protein [Verrucomicrobiae bacterium]